ncbi:flagellar hook-associated protein 2 [Mesobacillus sp. S13]|uniref:flagellar hook-associated protein 2 n=1 Tax=Mesobacillus sp. S13 TaxID=2880221 RepID=UPI001CF393AD|nr:flagellar hook-associated protein 2 [Mesobacillus sp. S13]
MVRIGGLASGMDIDTLVGDLMKAERIPLNKLHQKKQLMEWQRDDYRTMNKLLADLDELIKNGLYRSSTFTKKIVTTSDESAVSVRSISATSNMNSSLQVHTLAEAANMTSNGSVVTNLEGFDPNKTLDSQRGLFSQPFSDTQITIQSIGKDGKLGVMTPIPIDPSVDSLNTVIDKINNSNAGVIAFFDSVTGKFSISAKNTGDIIGDAEIHLGGDFLTSALKMDDNNQLAVDAGNIPPRGKAGVNADFTINGLRTTRSSNIFVINGFEYTLKKTTASSVKVSSATDEETVFKSVKEFVDKYNETISKISSEVKEERYRKYQPLTDEDREGMTEKQAELWDEKAKSGMLRGDSILIGALNKMRSDLGGTFGVPGIDGINDNYDQLADIGIKTSSNYRDGGKLIIDDNKLREAIKNDPNAIYQLFNNNGAGDSQGLVLRLRSTIENTVKNIEARAGNVFRTNSQFTLGRNLNNIDKQINRFENRLIKVEDRYWRQFTAMEKAIYKANEQSAQLMSQFSGM